MVSGKEDDENKLDFSLLTKQLSLISSDSSISSRLSSESWPLFLNVHFVDHYIFGDIIGNGSYATVRECIDTRNLERCVVKIVDKNYLNRQAPLALRNQLQEIKLLKRLNNHNIIELKECLFKGPKIYIVLEYCSYVLSDLLAEKKGNKLCSTLARNLFHQLCCGLNYLHSNRVVHRDIKPQNLLITTCGVLKIIDFGVSHILPMFTTDDLCSNYEGTPLFQAPEVVSGQTEYAGFKVDVWSSGITLYLMLYGQYPFYDNTLLGLYDKILSDNFKSISDESVPCKEVLDDLIACMLDKVVDRRASIEQVLEHPWMTIDCSVQFQGHSEFIELNQGNGKFTNSNEENSQNNKQETRHDIIKEQTTILNAANNNNKYKDIYRSMTVLPYLHNHHFPNLPVMKVKAKSDQTINSDRSSSNSISPSITPSISPIALNETHPSSANSEASSLSHCSSVLNHNDPHEVIEDRPIEWGTEEQYKLLKIPHVRANRIKYCKKRKGNRHRLNKQIFPPFTLH